MDPSSLKLSELIGAPRFSTYLTYYEGNEALALRLYSWNIAASSALWGPLGIVEVCVRNAIHHQMCLRASRDDWWTSPTTYLMERERVALEGTIEKLKRRGVEFPSSDDIVAATSFGLWTGLLSEGLPRHPTLSYETTYWQPRLHRAFPRYGGSRKQLYRQLDDLRQIRNRIAHHEPIFKTDLIRVVEQIVQVADYVSADAAEYIRGSSRLESVIAAKRDFISAGDACHF